MFNWLKPAPKTKPIEIQLGEKDILVVTIDEDALKRLHVRGEVIVNVTQYIRNELASGETKVISLPSWVSLSVIHKT